MLNRFFKWTAFRALWIRRATARHAVRQSWSIQGSAHRSPMPHPKPRRVRWVLSLHCSNPGFETLPVCGTLATASCMCQAGHGKHDGLAGAARSPAPALDLIVRLHLYPQIFGVRPVWQMEITRRYCVSLFKLQFDGIPGLASMQQLGNGEVHEAFCAGSGSCFGRAGPYCRSPST